MLWQNFQLRLPRVTILFKEDNTNLFFSERYLFPKLHGIQKKKMYLLKTNLVKISNNQHSSLHSTLTLLVQPILQHESEQKVLHGQIRNNSLK